MLQNCYREFRWRLRSDKDRERSISKGRFDRSNVPTISSRMFDMWHWNRTIRSIRNGRRSFDSSSRICSIDVVHRLGQELIEQDPVWHSDDSHPLIFSNVVRQHSRQEKERRKNIEKTVGDFLRRCRLRFFLLTKKSVHKISSMDSWLDAISSSSQAWIGYEVRTSFMRRIYLCKTWEVICSSIEANLSREDSSITVSFAWWILFKVHRILMRRSWTTSNQMLSTELLRSLWSTSCPPVKSSQPSRTSFAVRIFVVQGPLSPSIRYNNRSDGRHSSTFSLTNWEGSHVQGHYDHFHAPSFHWQNHDDKSNTKTFLTDTAHCCTL